MHPLQVVRRLLLLVVAERPPRHDEQGERRQRGRGSSAQRGVATPEAVDPPCGRRDEGDERLTRAGRHPVEHVAARRHLTQRRELRLPQRVR